MKVAFNSLSRWTRLLLACFALATVVPTTASSITPVAEKVLVSRDGPPVQLPGRRLDKRVQLTVRGEAADGNRQDLRASDSVLAPEPLSSCGPKRIFILNRALLL